MSSKKKNLSELYGGSIFDFNNTTNNNTGDLEKMIKESKPEPIVLNAKQIELVESELKQTDSKTKNKNTHNDRTIYNEDSIKSLSPREFTRLRPATYLGSNEYSTQLVREVFSNALDEHIIGHGNLIKVDINTKSNYYTVEDFGQGFPINVKKDNETVLQAAFDKFNTSGKYDSDGVYGGSVLGLNGIGAKLTNFLSKTLIVTSENQDKLVEEIEFKDGILINRTAKPCGLGHSGTKVQWQPDPQFFQNAAANINDLKKAIWRYFSIMPSINN